MRFAIFLRVSIIIPAEHLVRIDIAPSVTVTQGEWHFFFPVKSWIVNS